MPEQHTASEPPAVADVDVRFTLNQLRRDIEVLRNAQSVISGWELEPIDALDDRIEQLERDAGFLCSRVASRA